MPELNPPILIGLWVLSIIIAAVIFKAVFGVNKSLYYQQKQLDILIKIAEKQGVTAAELEQILGPAKTSYPDIGPLVPIDKIKTQE